MRRLRRRGLVPGILYGGGGEPQTFSVEARVLRNALAARGAVLDLSIDGAAPTPVVLKETQRDPVRGATLHVDLVRVRLDRAIHATVPVELIGAEDAPGVRDGGVLEHVSHELNVEALPTAIPESIIHDVSGMSIGDTLLLGALRAPEGVTLLGDPEEVVIATLSPPRLRLEADDEIEQETGLVGAAGGDADSAAAETDGAGDGE